MPDGNTNTLAQHRVKCFFVEKRDLDEPIMQLKCAVGVREVTREPFDEGITLIVTIDPAYNQEDVTDRIKRLVAAWGRRREFPTEFES